MAISCLSRRLFSVTAVAFPLTLIVPTYEPVQGASHGQVPEARVYSSISVPEESHAFRKALITRDASGSIGDAVHLDVRLTNTTNDEIDSLMLVCSQGELIITDNINATSLDKKDHIIDITNWNLSNLSIYQLNKKARRVLFTLVATFRSRTSGRTYAETGNLEVNFADIPQDSETVYSNVGSRDAGALVDSNVLTSDVFVAEAPTIPPLKTSLSSSTDAYRASHGPLGIDHEAPSANTRAEVSKETAPPLGSEIDVGPLVARAKGLIQRGDISGARLLLEHARARNAPEATFLLAQTYDPAMLRAWKVRGLRADPDLARGLYAKAAEQGQADARRLAATSH